MQDQYGLFLQADKEARMNIIGGILGLGVYEKMEQLALDILADTKRDINNLTDRAANITAELPNVDDVESQIIKAEQCRQEYEEYLRQKMADLNEMKFRLNMKCEAESRLIKLKNKINTLEATRTTKETTKTLQLGIISSADVILAEEKKIIAGVAQYNELLKQEKELIETKNEYDNLMKRKKSITKEVLSTEKSANKKQKEKERITTEKIVPLQQNLKRADELEKKYKEYEEIKNQKSELESLKSDWEQKKTILQTADNELNRIDSEHERKANELKNQRNMLKEKVKLLTNSNCPNIEKASCTFLKDALAAKKELPEIEAKLEEEEKEYQNIHTSASEFFISAQKAFKECLYSPEKIDVLCDKLNDLESAKDEYKDLQSHEKELQFLNEKIYDLQLSIEEYNNTIADKNEELKVIDNKLSKIAQVGADFERLKKDIITASQWLEKEKQLPVAREKKIMAQERIQELELEIKNLETEITQAKEEQLEEQKKILGKEKLQEQVEIEEAEISKLQKETQTVSITIGGLKNKREYIRDRLKQAEELQIKVNSLSVTAAGYEELKKAFSQDGIPHNIIRSIIPIFEATATNILAQMSGGKMSIEFVTEKLLKSNNKKEVTTLDIIINDSDTGRLPYMSRSGGERVKAALSVILALSEIKSSKTGVQLGFLFIDEPPFLDTQGVQAYCDALEAIQTRYRNLKVMAITHDPAMKSRFPQSIEVVKMRDGSKVIYE